MAVDWSLTCEVSVIVPAYNVAQLIREAIASILDQGYPRLEIIVVDDGSTDGTPEALPNLPFIRCLRREHGGPAAARNTGLLAARGRLLAFLDADDIWEPQSLRSRVDFLAHEPDLGMVFGDIRFFDDAGMVSESHLAGLRTFRRAPTRQPRPGHHVFLRSVTAECIIEPFMPIDTVLVRRECLDSVGLFDESLWIGEDTDLWSRIAAGYPIGFVDRTLARCRRRAGSLTSDPETVILGRLAAARKFLRNGHEPEVERVLRERTGRLLVELGEHHMAKGRDGQARRCFVAGIRYRSARRSSFLYLFASFLTAPGRNAVLSLYRWFRRRYPARRSWVR